MRYARAATGLLSFLWPVLLHAGLICSPLGRDAELRVIQAVQAKYHLPADLVLTISGDSLLDGSCERKLELRAGEGRNAYSTTVYLSPDERFLAFSLVDLLRGTADDEAKIAATAAQLKSGRVPFLGPAEASIVVTVFSDLECPYCRTFMRDLRARQSSSDWIGVKVTYRHLPLPTHPWAKEAAEITTCAELQSSEAFWRLHDVIFDHQNEIKPQTARESLVALGDNTGLDIAAFHACVEDGLGLGMVERDVRVATALGVYGTPTAFVNGKRIEPPGSLDAVKDAIIALKKQQSRH